MPRRNKKRATKRTTTTINNNKAVVPFRPTASLPRSPLRVSGHVCSLFLDEYFDAQWGRGWQMPFFFVWDCQRYGDGLEGPFGGHWSWQLQELQEGHDGHMRFVATALFRTGISSSKTRLMIWCRVEMVCTAQSMRRRCVCGGPTLGMLVTRGCTVQSPRAAFFGRVVVFPCCFFLVLFFLLYMFLPVVTIFSLLATTVTINLSACTSCHTLAVLVQPLLHTNSTTTHSPHTCLLMSG